MSDRLPFDASKTQAGFAALREARTAVREAIARDAYARREVRVVDPDLADYPWLAATHRGLFAVTHGHVKTVMHGWFFGLCQHGRALYLFENCGHRDRSQRLGRIVRFDIADGRLVAPHVLIEGLHGNCHQIRVIDGLLCIVDTADQAILRFTLDGQAVDIRRPFPPAPLEDTSGAYLHVNALARIGNRVAIMLHNGKTVPQKRSELAWLDADWQLVERRTLPGHKCHDIVVEGDKLWHSDSMAGDIIASDGTRICVSDALMTRGLVVGPETIVVGLSSFGPRHLRSALHGAVVLIDRTTGAREQMILDGGPTDIILLQ